MITTRKDWTLYDQDGRIGGTITGPLTAEEASEKDGQGRQAIQGGYSTHTHYVDVEDGQAKPRPDTGLPETHTLSADTDWSPSPVPNGTIVSIDRDPQPEPTHAGLVLNFPEPGEYVVRLDPPFPWKPAICKVTVE